MKGPPSHRCFLPSCGSFGQAVSEENFFLEIDQSETRIAYGGHVYKRIGIKLAKCLADFHIFLLNRLAK
jgi:hypothetical protein